MLSVNDFILRFQIWLVTNVYQIYPAQTSINNLKKNKKMKKILFIFAFVAMAVSASAKKVAIQGKTYDITERFCQTEDLQIAKLKAAKNIYAVYLYEDGYQPTNISDGDWTFIEYDKANQTHYVSAGQHAKKVIIKDKEATFCSNADFANNLDPSNVVYYNYAGQDFGYIYATDKDNNHVVLIYDW